MINYLQALHACSDELKWNKISSRHLELYQNLVERFFVTSWLSFHCLVVEKASVDKTLHNGDFDLARRKHFTTLLVNKIKRRVRVGHGRPQTFRIWVDPIASRYRKADEVVEIVTNRVLAKVFGKVRPVDKVRTRDSKHTASIQLCDILLGAVLDAWQRSASSAAKHTISQLIAEHLGWPDLRSDTKPTERKFNIWHLYDKACGPRRITTRDVHLKYPLPRRHPHTRSEAKV